MNLSSSLPYKVKMEKCHVVNVEHNAFVRQFREPEREREKEERELSLIRRVKEKSYSLMIPDNTQCGGRLS